MWFVIQVEYENPEWSYWYITDNLEEYQVEPFPYMTEVVLSQIEGCKITIRPYKGRGKREITIDGIVVEIPHYGECKCTNSH